MRSLFITFALLSLIDAKLLFAQIFIRHGYRYPLMPPHFDFETPEEVRFNEQFGGQLTNKGKRMMYDLGKRLRTIYGHILSPRYMEQEILGFHTDTSRTAIALQLTLAGLFPPAGKDVWNNDLLWQPMAINLDRHIMFNGFNNAERKCPTEHLKLVKNGVHAYIWNSMDQDLLQYLRKSTGFIIEDRGQIINIADAITSRYEDDDEVLMRQPWFNASYVPKMRQNFFNTYNKLAIFAQQTSRINVARVVDLLESYMKDPRKKLVIFSGHEINMMRIVRTLKINVYTQQMPGFASHMAFELHEENGVLLVKFLATYDDVTPKREYEIGLCPSPCTLDDFLAATRPFRISIGDFLRWCRTPDEEF